MKKEKQNIFFLILFILFWIFTTISFIRNKNTENLVANRSSYQFENWTLQNYLSNQYQENMEEASKDQMPFYNYFQIIYPKIKTLVNYHTASHLDQEQYINLGSGIYLYKNYLVYEPINQEEMKEKYKEDLQKINTIAEQTSANVYLYYINGDTNNRFDKQETLDVDSYIKENLTDTISYSSLEIPSFDDYKKYYYQSDHHLNHSGTDKVYQDLVKQMNLGEALTKEKETCWDNKKVLGSKTKVLAVNNLERETICMNSYSLPSFKIEINQEESNYGTSIAEIEQSKEISYAMMYGSDYAEIVFKNEGSRNEKKLLIFSNSYSNSLNKLLASHYQETYVIDGRYYESFNLIEYVQEKQIDDILVFANKMLFYDDIDWGDF